MKVQYEGHEQLSIMLHAKNYNNKLYDFISKDLCSESLVLDFGAGIGAFSNRFDNQKRIYVVEPDPVQLQMSHSKNKFSSIKNLDNTLFDVIYSLNVLEHIKEDKLMVNELQKHLKIGGELRIFVPAKMILYSSMDRAVGHFRRYEKETLINLFDANNLEIISCHYFDFAGYFAALLYKYIGDENGEITKKSILFYDRIVFPLSKVLDKMSFGKLLGKNLMIVVRKTS